MSTAGKWLLGTSIIALFTFQATSEPLPIPVPTVKITSQQTSALFEGRSAKLIIAATADHQDSAALYLIDFNKSPLTPELIRGNARVTHGDPMISPDGSRVAYAVQGPRSRDYAGGLRICKAEKGGSGETVIADSGFCPSWWVHPKTGDEYIVYVSTPSAVGDISAAGKTYIQKIVKGTTQLYGSPKVLIADFAFRFGRSPDGKYMATNYPAWAIAELKPDAVENAFVRFHFRGGRSCMGSVSQDPSYPDNMLWFLVGHGSTVQDIWEWTPLPKWPEPFYAGQYNRWSNHHDYITVCLLNNVDKRQPSEWNNSTNEVGVYQFSKRQWTVVAKGTRASILWVAKKPLRKAPVFEVDGKQMAHIRSHAYAFPGTATVKLSAADGSKILYSYTDTIPVSQWKEYTGPLTVNATTAISAVSVSPDPSAYDNCGPVRLRLQKCSWYTGVIFGTPPNGKGERYGYHAAYDGSSSTYFKGSCSAKGSDEPAGSEFMPFTGVDLFSPRTMTKVTIKGDTRRPSTIEGARIQGSNVDWNDGYVDLAKVTGAPGSTQTISITSKNAYRYYRYICPPPPGDANFSNSTDYQSTIAELSFEFGSGPIAGTVQTPSITPHGGEFSSSSLEIRMSTITDSATIYYTLDGSAPGATSRKYTGPFTISEAVTIKAAAVKNSIWSDTDIAVFSKSAEKVATPAITPSGTVFEGTIMVGISAITSGAEIRYTLDGSDPGPSSSKYTSQVTLDHTAIVKARAFKAGLTHSELSYRSFILKSDHDLNSGGKLLAPNGGESLRVGDTVVIKWQTHDPTLFYDALVDISADGGKSWLPIFTNTAVGMGLGQWGNYAWKIPSEIDGETLVSSTCLMRIVQYNGSEIDVSDAKFGIAGPSNAAAIPGAGFAPKKSAVSGRRGLALYQAMNPNNPGVYSLGGRLLRLRQGVPDQAVSSSVYVVRPEANIRAGKARTLAVPE